MSPWRQIYTKRLLEFTYARSNVYKILALCFQYPDRDLVKNLMQGSLLSALEDCLKKTEAAEQLDEGLVIARAFIDRHRKTEPDSLHTELAAEHVRLFVAGTRVPCPPYESVYREGVPFIERGLVMGESVVDVVEKYSAAGLVASKLHKDLPDHVSTELEFMHFLCFKEAEARRKGEPSDVSKYLQMQRDFMQDHTTKWIPRFCAKVMMETVVGFYQGMAKIAAAFATVDHDRAGSLNWSELSGF